MPDGGARHLASRSHVGAGTLKALVMLDEKSRGAKLLFDGHPLSLGTVRLAIVVGIAYFMAAMLGLALRASTGTSVFWPAAGISVAALIVCGPSARLPVAAGVVFATLVSNLIIGRTTGLVVVFAVVNAGQALLTTWLVERWFGRSFKLGGVSHVLGFLLASTIASTIAATGAAIAAVLFESALPFFTFWRVWFGSCLLGIIAVAPLLVGIAEAVRQLPPRAELLEGMAGLSLLGALSAIAIALPEGPWSTALPLAIVFPVLLCIAVRCRPAFAAGSAFIVAFTVVGSITFGFGHFGDPTIALADRVLAAQTIVLTGVVLSLVLAALFAERRGTQFMLERSNRRLQLALDGAELGAFSADLTTGRLECDAHAAFIHGLKLPATTLKESRRFVHPDDLGRIDAALSRAWHAGDIWTAEYRVVHPPGHPHAGETRWVSVEGSIVHDPESGRAGLLGVTRDITERKIAQQGAQRLVSIVESSEDAIISKDLNGIILSWNQGAERLFGYSAEEVIGRSILVLIPSDRQRDEMMILDRIRSGEPFKHYETIRCRKNGTFVDISLTLSPIRDGMGVIVGVSKIARDISDRKKSEAALAERTIQLAIAGKAARVGSFAYDLDTEILQITPGYAAIHDFPDGTTEIARKEWQVRVHPEDSVRWEALRSRAHRERWQEYSGEYRIVRSGNEVRWIEARVFVSYATDGRPHRAVGIDIDITARKRADEQQRLLNAELDHRVKNVLATVSAIITQTPKVGISLADFVARFDGRIKSLARTHELLSHNNWQDVSLAEVIQRETAPYAAGNATIVGPGVTLKAAAAQAVASVLHELATNAAKHGAFSRPSGRLFVGWRWLENGSQGRVAIHWQESGGPAVSTPNQTGFGTSVIRELIPFELGGTVDLTFASNGLQCRLDIPCDWVSSDAPIGNASRGRDLGQTVYRN